jgi:hypothetical protein
MKPEEDLLEIPAFLIIPQEQRRKAWELWDAMKAQEARDKEHAPPMRKAA